MARIKPLELETAPTASQTLLRDELARTGRVTNMKRTLARSPAALHALLEWYPLHRAIVAFIGERAAILFAAAISNASECILCSTYMRRILVEWNEDPDHPRLDAREAVLVEFGRRLGQDANSVDEPLFARLREHFNDDQIVELASFAALMIATNVFNNALHVDLDQNLLPYVRKDSKAAHLSSTAS